MKVQERLKSLAQRIGNPDQELKKLRENDPNNILDLLIYHRITSYAGETAGIKSFRKLKNSFVDWNEVRISPIPEIQKALGSAAPSSLAVAVFIKDLLDFLHHQALDILAALRRLNGSAPPPYTPTHRRQEDRTLSLGVR